MKRSIFRWFKGISIAKKLYCTVGIMGLIIIVELAVLFFSINTLSYVGAYVGGEGLWSKAQKDALYALLKYARTRNEADYMLFRGFMKVNQGDNDARKELSKANPDFPIVRKAFIAGRTHPDDVNGIHILVTRLHPNQTLPPPIPPQR